MYNASKPIGNKRIPMVKKNKKGMANTWISHGAFKS
jgi:hypothetical protein